MYVRAHIPATTLYDTTSIKSSNENLPILERPKSFKRADLIPSGYELAGNLRAVYESLNLHTYPMLDKQLIKCLEDTFKDLEVTRPVIPKVENLVSRLGRKVHPATKRLLESVLPGNNKRLDQLGLLILISLDLVTSASDVDPSQDDAAATVTANLQFASAQLRFAFDICYATSAHNVRTGRDFASREVGLPIDNATASDRRGSYFQPADFAALQLQSEQSKALHTAAGPKRSGHFVDRRNAKRAKFGRGRGGYGSSNRTWHRSNGRGGGRRPFRGRGRGRGGRVSQ